MLKRKAKECFNTLLDDSEDHINTKQEISQRKIFRAKRPVRTLLQNSPTKFKVHKQLISLEQEVNMLSLHTNTQRILCTVPSQLASTIGAKGLPDN